MTVDPLTALLFFVLLSKSKAGGGGGRGKPPDDHTYPPPGGGGGVSPIAYKTGPAQSGWKPYKPLTEDVIARAKEILANPASPHETIEKDAAGGIVRYLRTTDNPPGHTSVTAWRPKDGAAAQPGVAV